ncbi:MAG: hypothetical protein JNK05_17760 [Myxococcales bacterium]|nr:hypothetical protein [Myxococcales bacterium]
MIRFEGFDAKSWHRLVTIFAPGFASRPPNAHAERERAPGGLLLVVFRGTSVVAAVHSHRGRCEIDGWRGASSMQKLAEQTDAQFVIAVEDGALELLLDRWGARVDLDEPSREGWLLLVDAVREIVDERKIYFWPDLVPGGLPRPTRTVIDGAADLVLPAGRAAYAILVRDDSTLDAAIAIARPVGAPFTVIGGERIVGAIGALEGNPRRDMQAVRAWLDRELAPVHVGLHAKTSTIEALLRAEQAGAWSRAFNEGQLVIDPSPPWVVAGLGADVARSAIVAARGVLGTLMDRVAPALESATRVASARATLSGLLGLDVGSVVGSVLRRSSTPTPSSSEDESD